ncbi:MAG: CoA transferase subunit A [Eubacteriales bacterium]
MKEPITAKEALEKVKSGDIIMIGGFLYGGNPQHLVKALIETSADELTIISSDTGTKDCQHYQLSLSGKIKKVIASYIGANPETGRTMMSGEVEVELCPQGTLAERIRAGGAGLGGILTPTGVGTIVEEGKQKMKIDDREYLLELPLKADVALIKAKTADSAGNLVVEGTSRNFNCAMAMAADYVVAQVEEYVEAGQIDPNLITVPGVFVDAIVKVGA